LKDDLKFIRIIWHSLRSKKKKDRLVWRPGSSVCPWSIINDYRVCQDFLTKTAQQSWVSLKKLYLGLSLNFYLFFPQLLSDMGKL